MLMAAMTLTSCVGGEGFKQLQKERQESEKEKCPVTVTYTINCTQDVVDAIDMVIKYKDKGGTNATDTIRDTVWTKTIVNDYIPVKIGLDWSLAPKPADKITKDTFDELNITYSITLQSTEPCRPAADNYPIISYRDFPASKLADLCDFANYEQTVARNHHDWNFSCFLVERDMINGVPDPNRIDFSRADWDD